MMVLILITLVRIFLLDIGAFSGLTIHFKDGCWNYLCQDMLDYQCVSTIWMIFLVSGMSITTSDILQIPVFGNITGGYTISQWMYLQELLKKMPIFKSNLKLMNLR